MSKYLHFETKAGAANRSKELWGGDEDAVTQHLYGFVESRKTTGGSFLIVPDDGGELNSDEKSNLQDHASYLEWVEQFLAPE
ncbi:MAG: hypothetical protein CL959_04780 [Euryarchaeota archaeon]|nr:hypothetical protein [Euryarchaeota archaeon]|tara:strand:+ start:120 stop:365 length:246 start_codon:yes stop_codon:yes gene_type:complete